VLLGRGLERGRRGVHRSWNAALLVDGSGREHRLDLAPMRYAMVRSQDFYALADDAAAQLGAVRVLAPADAVIDGQEFATVHTPEGPIEARWVLDSRPAVPRRPPVTALLQHFRGWTVRFGADAFDPTAPIFMDFSVPQPEHGVAFGYALPDDARSGLVEYTEFSRTRLTDAAYEKALTGYLDARFGGAGGYEITEVEDGVIPMTDAVHAGRVGARCCGWARRAARPAVRPATRWPRCSGRPPRSRPTCSRFAGRAARARPRRGSRVDRTRCCCGPGRRTSTGRHAVSPGGWLTELRRRGAALPRRALARR
jgi:lycopene beta-cyclase